MVKAFGMMMWVRGENQERYKVSSQKYQFLKEEFARIQSEEQAGKLNSQFGWIWISNGNENKKIKGSEKIPLNWHRGRNLDCTRTKHFCERCQKEVDWRKNGHHAKFCNICRANRTINKSYIKKCVVCDAEFSKRKVKTCSNKCKQLFQKTINSKRACKKVQCIETGETFPSLTDVARKINSSISLISYVLSGKLVNAKGFTFKFM